MSTLSKKVKLDEIKLEQKAHASTYSLRYFIESVPQHEMPEDSMPPKAAYQLIQDELNLDGNPVLNLASFVTTWMEPEARQIIDENLHKNFIDHDEYPQTEIIQQRVVNMLARLYNAAEEKAAVGTSTIGSSEAVMLALLFEISHKLRERGWIVPAYTLPPNAESIAIMRVVVKENFSRDMAEMLFKDIMQAYDLLGRGKVVELRLPKKEHKHLHRAC